MKYYECPCGYIYDPAEGENENGVESETAFENLPEDWVCPICQAEKKIIGKQTTDYIRAYPFCFPCVVCRTIKRSKECFS